MSLEGRIRELGLHEVCQLLGLSRKTGRLHVRAPLHALAAEIVLLHGSVVDAATWIVRDNERPGAIAMRPASPAPTAADTRRIQACVLDVIAWTDGDFRFVAAEPSEFASAALRLPIEPVLVEAAQRAEVWERVLDRIPGPRAIAAFVDVEPQQLPLLRLIPQEWEILTRVDGKRDLTTLASVLGRDLLDVVQIVHRLIGAGLLTVREGERAPRRHDTPPAQPAVSDPDLWIPEDNADAIFDPVSAGMTNPEGLPRLRTPYAPSAAIAVASPVREPSSPQQEHAPADVDVDALTLCRMGDEAARRGDLASALAHWTGALRPDAVPANGRHGLDADRIREAIALAARLHALLHPSTHDAPET